MGPLAGTRIIDLTSILMGPYATQFLADFGADVIKVEPPSGDLARDVPPSRTARMGAFFLNSNRSKRSIAIDLKTPEGRALLLEMCAGADVLVYNVRPAAMARLGLSWEEVREVAPRLVYAGCYGYGQAGPYAALPAYDDLIQGAAGLPHLHARASGAAPRYVPAATADRTVGLAALSAILAALLARERTGAGQRVDVPMFETMANVVLADHLSGLTHEPPTGPGGYDRHISPDRRPYATADGHVCAMVYTDGHWRRFLAAVGAADLPRRDPRFATFAARMENIDAVNAWLAETFLTRTSAEWFDLLIEADVPVMHMHDLEGLLADPHLAAVGFFQEIDHPSEGRMRTLMNPIAMSATPVDPPRPAPRLGEHGGEILREMGLDDERIRALSSAGAVVLPG